MPPRIAPTRCAFALLAAILLGATMLSPRSASAAGGIITTVAGGGVGDGGPATSASLYYPSGLAVSGGGDIYVADSQNCRVRLITSGTISTAAAGCGIGGETGDPEAVAVDAAGNLYVADFGGCRIRKVGSGVTTIVAGDGTCAYGGDGGAAASAKLNLPFGVAVDVGGNLYIADFGNCRIRKVTGGTITTIAGNGTCGYGGDGGPATSAQLSRPRSVAVDGAMNVYIAEIDNNYCRVREVSGGTITTVAGNGTCAYGGDGGAATSASLNRPSGIALDSANNLYIADSGNGYIRKVSGGTITSLIRVDAIDVAFDGSGNLYVVGQGSCSVNQVIGGVITRVAGTGICGYGGDDGLATNAAVRAPARVAVDGGGNVYLADRYSCRVRKVTAGTITRFAGDVCGYSGDGGPVGSASLNSPEFVAANTAGDLFIADAANCRVRKVTGGTITTVAGNGTCVYGGDGAAATSAGLNPRSVAVDASGNLYIVDASSCRVREVTGGTITTVAGNGMCIYSGDGGPATSAGISLLQYSAGIAVIGGIVYIPDGCRVRRVSGGTITTVAGTGTCGYSGDGMLATSANLNAPSGVATDGAGNLYIADYMNLRVRKVDGSGVITTVAGTGTLTCADGGLATGCGVGYPSDVAVDSGGNLYIVETHLSSNDEVRKVTATTPASVGGIAEPPHVAALPPRAAAASRHGEQAGVVAVAALAGIAVAGGWAVRRRRHAGR